MNPPVEEPVCWPNVSSSHRAPTKHLRLDSFQARQWLECLKQLSPSGEPAEALIEFRDELEDALWLAQWKREDVVMELELSFVSCLIDALADRRPNSISKQTLDIQEDVLAALSKISGWT